MGGYKLLFSFNGKNVCTKVYSCVCSGRLNQLNTYNVQKYLRKQFYHSNKHTFIFYLHIVASSAYYF